MKTQLIKNYKSIIKECFSEDKDLLEKYHISAGEGLDSCVDKTFNDLSNADLLFYSVNLDNTLIGFFGVESIEEHKALSGFFIKPQYRKHKEEFWSLIEIQMEHKPFLCGVYNKNTRAIKFLKSMGGIPAFNVGNGIIFKLGGNLCQ